MHKVTYFHLPSCPYCKQADRILEELQREHPEYAAVEFERINEMEQPELADQYDYYANPSMFIGKEKIYEAHLFTFFRKNVLYRTRVLVYYSKC